LSSYLHFHLSISDDRVLKKLKEFGPSMIDIEIHSLSPEGGGSVHLMCQFLKFIEYVLSTNKNFELAQAYVGLFLKVRIKVLPLVLLASIAFTITPKFGSGGLQVFER
jgi:hypothetical protein